MQGFIAARVGEGWCLRRSAWRAAFRAADLAGVRVCVRSGGPHHIPGRLPAQNYCRRWKSAPVKTGPQRCLPTLSVPVFSNVWLAACTRRPLLLGASASLRDAVCAVLAGRAKPLPPGPGVLEVGPSKILQEEMPIPWRPDGLAMKPPHIKTSTEAF